MTLNERVSWVMNNVMQRYKLNYNQLGQALDVNKNTVQSYLSGRGDIVGRALAGLVKTYGINGEWLITGRGEPFPGAREEYPDICGDPGVSIEAQNKVIKFVKENTLSDVTEQKINIEESIGKTYAILSSNTELSICLNNIIQQLSLFNKTIEELSNCRDELRQKHKQIEDMKNNQGKDKQWF